MEHNDKLILVRNGDAETIAEHLNSYAEVSNVEGGKKCSVELYKDSLGEHILLFPNNIPYYDFTTILSALDAPWTSTTGMQAAAWATHNNEELLIYSPGATNGILLAVSKTNTLYAIDAGENEPLEAEKLPVEYFTYAFDKGALEKVASFELLVDETVPAPPEDIVFEELDNTPAAPVKKISTAAIVVVIVVVSAFLIWLLSMLG